MKTNAIVRNLLLLLFLVTTFSGFSQHKNKEKIKALKVSYISEELDLTAKEAEKILANIQRS